MPSENLSYTLQNEDSNQSVVYPVCFSLLHYTVIQYLDYNGVWEWEGEGVGGNHPNNPIWMIVGQGPIALAVVRVGLFGYFFSHLSFLSSFSLSLGDGPI